VTTSISRRIHRRRRMAIAVTAALCAAQGAHAQIYPPAIVTSGSSLTIEQFYDGRYVPTGLIQGSVTIHPVPPYPTQLGGAGVSVFFGSQVTIDPNQGTPGQIAITSDYRSGAPNDALYIANGTVTIAPSSAGVLLTGNGQSVQGIYMPESSAGPSLLNGSNVTIVTNGAGADGIRPYGGTSTINLANVGITVNGSNSWGLRSWGGSNVTLSNAAITAKGTGGGVEVYNGSIGTINGNSLISTDVAGNFGLYATSGGFLNTNTDAATSGTVTVNTTGAGAHAVRISTATGDLNRLSANTTQNSTYGLYVNGTSTVIGSAVAVSTQGTSAYGMWLGGSSTVTLNGGSISTQGQTAYGLLSGSGASTVNLSDFAIATHGDRGYGIYGWTGSTTNFSGGSISTDQASTYGIYANAGSVNLLRDASDAGTIITTSGANAYDVRIQNGGSFNATGAALHATGSGGAGVVFDAPQTLAAPGLVGATPGLPSLPAVAPLLDSNTPPPPPAIITPDSVAPAEVAANAPFPASAAPGSAADPPASGGYNMTLHDTNITSDQSAALWIYGGIANVNLTDSTLTGGTGALYASARSLTGGALLGATVLVDANHSVLNGRIFTDAQSTTTLNLANDSAWHVSASSNLTNLSNADSVIDFPVTPALTADPTVAGAYRSVTVAGQYAGSHGTIALNTYLGGDGSPSDQLILNSGAASGDTQLLIHNSGGPGALTHTNGILVVSAVNQATTTDDAFSLGNEVRGGAYTYALFRGATDGSSADSWYLRSEFVVPPPVPAPGYCLCHARPGGRPRRPARRR